MTKAAVLMFAFNYLGRAMVLTLQAAQEDLESVRKLDALQPGLQQQEQRLQHLMARSKASDAALFQHTLPA